ncbi:Copper chaperone CopZ [Methylophilaceae bacterium]|nr:Copper chaperone CopZ [Methylophilaceae bacterium]
MHIFTVDDMTCGHCAGVINKAINALDAAARTEIDLASKTVKVESKASRQEIGNAIADAGYTPIAQ